MGYRRPIDNPWEILWDIILRYIRAKGLASDWMSNDVLNLSDSRSSPDILYITYYIYHGSYHIYILY